MKLVLMTNTNKIKIRTKKIEGEDVELGEKVLELLQKTLYLLEDVAEIELKLVQPFEQKQTYLVEELFTLFPNLSIAYFYQD